MNPRNGLYKVSSRITRGENRKKESKRVQIRKGPPFANSETKSLAKTFKNIVKIVGNGQLNKDY